MEKSEQENRPEPRKASIPPVCDWWWSIFFDIVYLVSTGAIVAVLDYLQDLQKKGYNLQYINSEFDDIINLWKKYTFFVTSEDPVDKIYENIKNGVLERQKIIMIFAYGYAKNNATLAVARILTENLVNGMKVKIVLKVKRKYTPHFYL